MQHTAYRMALVLALLSLTLLGCGAQTPAAGNGEPAALPELELQDSAITADGRLAPKAWAQLGFAAGGTVAEVLVGPGDTVARGEALVRLDGGAQAAAAVAAARLELLAAQQARQALDDAVPVEQARALQALVAARQSVREAEQRVAYLEGASPEAEAVSADAQLVQAEAALEDAEEAYEDVADRDRTDPIRLQLQVALANARLAYEEAARTSAALSAQEQTKMLDLARNTLRAAQLTLRGAENAYAVLESGVDPDTLAAADARVEVAQAHFTAAQASLDALTLRTPLAGTVVQVSAKVGETAIPAAPVVTVADLSGWVIETDNLTQIDVVAIEVGQTVSAVVDALPDLELTGEVVAIDGLFQDKRGDVTYTVQIRLTGNDPRLRWGMTCALTFAQ